MTAAETFRTRARLRRLIREFFDARGSVEIDTPVLVPCPGTEVHLDYFETRWENPPHPPRRLFLRSSPELHMKQAVAEGLEKAYQIGPCFRSGGEKTSLHHPEFTLLEWYEARIPFDDFITQTEELVRHCRDGLGDLRTGEAAFSWPERMERIRVGEAFREFASLELKDEDPDLAAKACEKGLVSVRPEDDFETAFFKVLLEQVEPRLAEKKLACLYDYPPSQAALAKVDRGVAKRFEVYANGIELCNGFGELLDLQENKRRIQQTQLRRRELEKTTVPPEDPDFYAALERGLPPLCGNALGFDRLLAVLLGDKSLDRAVNFRGASIFSD